MFKNIFKKNKRTLNLDQQLVHSLRGSRLPSLTQIKYIKTFLSKTESRVLTASAVLLILAGSFLSYRFYANHLVEVPAFGGEYIEAVVGEPKYINPLYSSINDVDSDLASLVYSSLYRVSKQGKLEFDLLAEASVSADGKVHTFKLKPNVRWHNGNLLTANDVLFTFNAIKNVAYKSPLRQSFQGVEAEVIDDLTIKFSLKEPYAGFSSLLTFGILPQELWEQLAPNAVSLAELNLKPIGSGPYKFKSFVKDKSGNLKSFNLVANADYHGGRPRISDLKIQFFPSYEEAHAALESSAADGMGYFAGQFSRAEITKSFLSYNAMPSGQIKAVFFNTKSQILSDAKVRQAIAMSFDKDALVRQSTEQVGSRIDAAIMPQNEFYSDSYRKYSLNQDEAVKLVESAGWKLVDITAADVAGADELIKSGDAKKKKAGESYKMLGQGRWYYKDGDYLILKLTAVDLGDNVQIAEALQKALATIKIHLAVEMVPASQIQSDVIKTRDYDALLTGEVLAVDPDPFFYWHSSQIGAEGLNLSNYSNKEVDKLLEEGRTAADSNRRKAVYARFLTIMGEQVPAVYLYSLNYDYVQNRKVKSINSAVVYSSSDRFAGVGEWYVKTDREFTW